MPDRNRGGAARRHLALALAVVLLTVVLTVRGSGAFAASPPPVAAEHGMVVAEQHLAAEIGVHVLEQGGNAVDAAVAVGYALAVVQPCCGNLGGGGFMMLRLADGKEIFLDFREKAPLAATPNLFLDEKGAVIPDLSIRGYRAVAVPGSVMGLEAARERYGTMSRAKLMAPAIALADKGFVLSDGDTAILATGTAVFSADPVLSAIFLDPAGKPFRPGARLVQKNLAATLRHIAEEGPNAFYKGPVADAVAAASEAGGGILTVEDFAGYTSAQRMPVSCAYRGYRVISAPPPSSGGTAICESLEILEAYPLAEQGFHSAASVHYLTEALRRAFLDRSRFFGDPDFVSVPVERLLSPEYIGSQKKGIQPSVATQSSELSQKEPKAEPKAEGKQTTHYSVIDRLGNAVAVTMTLNSYFGAKVMAPGTGFFLNNEMDDFTAKPGTPNMFGLIQGDANAIAPGKRPLSSMSPTIVTRDGKTVLVLGSPGGPRIVSAVLEVILDIVDYGMDVGEAVAAPRIHHQFLPDKLFTEPRALSADTAFLLKGMGYRIEEQAPWGAVEAVMAGTAADRALPSPGDDAVHRAGPEETPLLHGANDPRRPAGAAKGY